MLFSNEIKLKKISLHLYVHINAKKIFFIKQYRIRKFTKVLAMQNEIKLFSEQHLKCVHSVDFH